MYWSCEDVLEELAVTSELLGSETKQQYNLKTVKFVQSLSSNVSDATATVLSSWRAWEMFNTSILLTFDCAGILHWILYQ